MYGPYQCCLELMSDQIRKVDRFLRRRPEGDTICWSGSEPVSKITRIHSWCGGSHIMRIHSWREGSHISRIHTWCEGSHISRIHSWCSGSYVSRIHSWCGGDYSGSKRKRCTVRRSRCGLRRWLRCRLGWP